MRIVRCLVCSVVIVLAGLVAPSAADDLPGRWVAPDATYFLAIEQPQVIVDALVNPGLHKYLAAIPQYQQSDAPANLAKLGIAVTAFELKLGKSWRETLRELVTGIYVTHDPTVNAPVLFVRGKNAELLKKLNDVFVEIIEADASNKGKPSPVKSAEHNGLTGWTFGKDEAHVLIGEWLAISNKSDALRAVIDRRQGGNHQSLATQADFAELRKHGEGALVWGGARLDGLRKSPKLAEGLAQKQNPLVELLFGGLVESLGYSPLARFAVRADDNRLKVQLTLDRPQTTRPWYFGGDDNSLATRIAPPRMLGSITLSRDVERLWNDREKLFDEGTNAKFTQADSNLGLFFAGRDFGPDILGQLGTSWQLVAARREFTADEPEPSIKLPAFALVVELRDEKFAPTLVQAYQNIVGLTNIQAAQAGRPQLLMSSTEHAGATIHKATHAIIPKAESEQGKIDYNFQPSCAAAGKHFVIGSTVEIVRDAIDQLKSAKPAPHHSQVEVSTGELLKVLDLNRGLLVARHALNTGKPRDEADADIRQLFDAARFLDQATFRLQPGDKELTLELSVDYRSP